MHAYVIKLHQGVFIYVAGALFLSDNTHKLSTTNFRTLHCVALYFVCLLQFQFGHGSSLVKFICFMLKPISISTSIGPCGNVPWWSHQVEIFSALLAICVGNSPVTGDLPVQRRVTRRFGVFFICAWINGLSNNREAGDLRWHCAHYDVIVMSYQWH